MNPKPEENILSSSTRVKKLESALKTTIDAFRLSRARGQFPNSDIMKEGIMEEAITISKDLENKMTRMKISWIACISLFLALKEDKNITNQFTVHCGLKEWNFLQLVKRCKEALLAPSCGQTAPETKSPVEDVKKLATIKTYEDTAATMRTIPRNGDGVLHEAPSFGQNASGTKSPMEDTWTVVTQVTAVPVRTIPRPRVGVLHEDWGLPSQVYAGDVMVNNRITRRRSVDRVVYQVRHTDYKF